MNKSDVKIGNYYQFTFLPIWAVFDGAYKVTGYVSPEIVSAINDGRSIYSIFFEELGLNAELYNSYIEESTLVYVATKLITTDPIEESINDEEVTVYIPSTLVRFEESYEYIKGNRVSYSFSTNPRIFKNEKALNDYKTKAKSIVKEALGKTSEFSVDSISVEVFDNEVLTTNNEYNSFLKSREEKEVAAKIAEIQWRSNQESADRKLYKATLDAEAAKVNYEGRFDQLAAKIDEANKIVQNNIDQRNYLNKIKDYIIEVIGDIMIRQPTAFDGIPGLPTGYTATQVYNAIYSLVSQ